MANLQPIDEELLPDDMSVETISIFEETIFEQPGPVRVINSLFGVLGKTVERVSGRVVALQIKMPVDEAEARIKALLEDRINQIVFDEVRGSGRRNFEEREELEEGRKEFLACVRVIEDMKKPESELPPNVTSFLRQRREEVRYRLWLDFSEQENEELSKIIQALFQHIK